MDSVTQMALGAAVAGVVAGRQIGPKAILAGAIAGSLPDFDVFVPFTGAVESFTYHRSFSHSLFVLTAISPLIAWLIQRVFGAGRLSFRRAWLLSWLVLVTHTLLDCFTVYGTQIFWPLSDYPVSISSVFIIDPLYTLLLLAGLVALYRQRSQAYSINAICLAVSCVYLGWSLIAKQTVQGSIQASLESQSVSYEKLLTTPMPFNTLGWRFVAMQEVGYLEGYASVLDPADHTVQFHEYESDVALLSNIENHWPVQRLRRFTHGFYKVHNDKNDVQMTDLRMGVEGAYIFAFVVGEQTDSGVVAVPNREADTTRDFSGLSMLFERVFDSTVELPPR